MDWSTLSLMMTIGYLVTEKYTEHLRIPKLIGMIKNNANYIIQSSYRLLTSYKNLVDRYVQTNQ